MIKKVLLVLIIIILCSCKTTTGSVSVVDYETAVELMDNSDYLILDVRTNSEYNQEHIVNALNIPYDEITEEIMSEISTDTLIFVYCASGTRSAKAASTLKSLGYTVYDMGSINNLDFLKE